MTLSYHHDRRKPNKCISLVASCKIDRFYADKLLKHCVFLGLEVRAMTNYGNYCLGALLFYIPVSFIPSEWLNIILGE